MPEIIQVSGALIHDYPPELNDDTLIFRHQVPSLPKVPRREDTLAVRQEIWAHDMDKFVIIIPEIGILTRGAVLMVNEVRFLITGVDRKQ